MTEQERFMKEAVRQAKKAWALKEVPIGCVIVSEGKIIARGYNRRNTDKNTLSHAELNAIRKASKKLGDWRLEGCTMYVTLEPCQMCAGALVQSRIDEVVIGSMNPKAGCAGSVLNLLEMDGFNHKVKVTRGILEEECSAMLSDFFRELRQEKKLRKEALKNRLNEEERVMELETLRKDMVAAMKAKDKTTKEAVSSLIAAAKKVAIDEGCRDDISEALVDRVILKELKTVKEQLDTCPENREDLRAEYQARYDVIAKYAPQQMSEEEIRAYLEEKFAEVLATKNKGQIMKAVMGDLKGKADGKLINKVVAAICE